jgi:hypothetical protein
VDVANVWLDAIAVEVKDLESNKKTMRGVTEMLTLRDDRTVGWTTDCRWEDMMRLATALPGKRPNP